MKLTKGTHTRKVVIALLLLAAAGNASLSMAQSAGPFTASGSMITPRLDHTATLLADGRVLITGGSTGSSVPPGPLIDGAELYQPSTGAFTATGKMTRARSGQTATLLPDGRVLVAGGTNSAGAELYDPSTGRFTATGNMTTARIMHTATLLADGRVLVAGGMNGDVSTTSDLLTAELYDPATEIFTPTGSMHRPWVVARGTLLTDGSVLIGTELYRPSTGIFTAMRHPVYDYGYAASLLLDGRVFISGGGNSDPANCVAETELYDPGPGLFRSAQDMTLCRFAHTATLLPDGTVLIAGGAAYGVWGYQANLASTEIYDFANRRFGWIGDMTVGRQRHTATLLQDGRVLIAGGVGAPGYSTLSSSEVYSKPSRVRAVALLSLAGDGQGQGAILHSGTSQVASSGDPATSGEVLEIYLSGLADASVVPPQVAIGGRMADVVFFGKAPGFPELNQVNVRVPRGVAPGPAVPVRLTYLGRTSNEVTIGVR